MSESVASACSYTFYKPFYWGLDTVFNANVKLNIADILSLDKYPGFPVGDVVSLAKKARLILYEVDDGSGVLPCCQWREKEDSEEGLFIPRLGQLVSIFGRLSDFRNKRQLKVSCMFPEDDPNVEPLHWMEVALLHKTVYSKPFVVPPSIVQSEGSKGSAAKSTKEIIKSTVLGHMTGSAVKDRFTLSELCRDGQLLKLCVDRVKSECGKEDEAEIKEEFLSVVSDLPREGDIIPDLPPRCKETVFKVFSEDKHLLPIILSYIKGRQENPNSRSAQLGIQEEWIIEHVKQKESFRMMPPSRITKAIERLVELSEIYPVANKVYSYLK